MFHMEQFRGENVTKKKIMENLFLFQGVPEALEKLELPDEVAYQKGEIIYGRDNYERALGILLSGKAEAFAREKSALTNFFVGDTFGAAALFGGEEYVSVIRATTDCRVQFLPEKMLRQLFVDYPQTAVNYIAFLSAKVRFLNGKIATYTSAGVSGRLYYWLGANCDEAGHLPAGITMTKLAKTLNVGRTSLYRAVEELEKKGLIEKQNGKVILL